ncbi:MAG: pyruvate:ferredoxin (flavodoxin) oxidoreductase [Gemmatimonadota bacterium]|jgi:pyruvate-ferredoxin/flavodoxin oxidoreductase|nr:pyruvate:ferredoxin (flavodoxin) oxidoreductase [Gemmatimonadota bacterium]
MSRRKLVTIDGNEATASVAHRINEVISIYPITPSSPMGELSDEWSALGRKNIWGIVPEVIEMQSEGGASGTVHGSLQAGALTTTFTSSQGLLLMLPNMYKIAGELTSAVFHIAARTIATHALSIFGDHSDIYGARQTGFAMLAAGSVQEAHDFACIAQAASLRSRIPFLHFFDGFRTSHETAKIEELTDEDLATMIPNELVQAHRDRALSPDHPVLRGTAQNPDAFFQAREAINSFYAACPGLVEETMRDFASLTGRAYSLCDYVGHPDAERVVVLMGSGAETAHELVNWMTERGERVGVLKVRLYRPFPAEQILAALPASTKSVAVLDRAKEPGATGEPLYVDLVTALAQARAEGNSPFESDPVLVGGRYGLSSKEFDPAMVHAVFENLAADSPRNHFTVGIVDDVTHTSLPVDDDFDIEPDDVFRGVFFGLGSDGTVGANKNSIKIIGEGTDNHAQGYFVYDSKKAGAVTISHLRFGPRPIRSSYLIRSAQFVACHQSVFMESQDMLEYAQPGAVFLLNTPHPPDKIWDELPREAQESILEKKLRFHCIDAYTVARDSGMGRRINTIMQTCFFAISGVLPRDEAIDRIKDAIRTTYGKKGDQVVQLNFDAVDRTLEHLHEAVVPESVTATRTRPPIVSSDAPDFVQRVTALMIAGKGDLLPVSAFPVDGTWPLSTTKWEKRNIGREIPTWDEDLCIQCNKCAMVCPHAAIRAKVFDPAHLDGAPETFLSVDYKTPDFQGFRYTIQVAPEDCTGCTLCSRVCPAKDKENPEHRALDMVPQAPLVAAEGENFDFFMEIPDPDRTKVQPGVKGAQFLRPLFEFSGACVGCGETPYVKLLTQLFGDRCLIANATGCSSIYGGNLPTTPFTTDADGRGPAWSNSLFEDNAEFGLGFRLAVDKTRDLARELLGQMEAELGGRLVGELLSADSSDEAALQAQRALVDEARRKLDTLDSAEGNRLRPLLDYLVPKSVWIVGGDGWAYDIGYGGLDHVLGVHRDVNVLVLDTEVYSNTGGQASKATPLGATAKFAMSGKSIPKKDLAQMAMAYGHVYVAQIAYGAKDTQTVKAFLEAESYPGPSVIIANSPCIAHGYGLEDSLDHMEAAVKSGFWPLFRFDPRRIALGKNPLIMDSKKPSISFEEYAMTETRFRMLLQSNPERSAELIASGQREINAKFDLYQQLARIRYDAAGSAEDAGQG